MSLGNFPLNSDVLPPAHACFQLCSSSSRWLIEGGSSQLLIRLRQILLSLLRIISWAASTGFSLRNRLPLLNQSMVDETLRLIIGRNIKISSLRFPASRLEVIINILHSVSCRTWNDIASLLQLFEPNDMKQVDFTCHPCLRTSKDLTTQWNWVECIVAL